MDAKRVRGGLLAAGAAFVAVLVVALLLFFANTREAERPAQIRTRAYLKGMGHQPEYRAERKSQLGRRRQRIHSRIWETG